MVIAQTPREHSAAVARPPPAWRGGEWGAGIIAHLDDWKFSGGQYADVPELYIITQLLPPDQLNYTKCVCAATPQIN